MEPTRRIEGEVAMRVTRRVMLIAGGVCGFLAGSVIAFGSVSLLALLARHWAPGAGPHSASLEFVIRLLLTVPGTIAGGIGGTIVVVRTIGRFQRW